jgi:hypothetical protein
MADGSGPADPLYPGKIGGEWKHTKAHVKVIVGGQDVTARLDPYLISVVVVDKKGWEVDTCALELDDRDARLVLPELHDVVSVYMGWGNESGSLLFQGYIDDVESGFSRRGGGRRMWVDAVGIDNGSMLKQLDKASLGVGDPPGQDNASESGSVPITSWLGQLSGLAGVPITAFGNIASIKRKHWSMGGESVMHHLQRIAREAGGVVKFDINGATLKDALANDGPNVRAKWGDNLIAWRIKPAMMRPQYAETVNEYFHIMTGIFPQVMGAIQNGSPFGMGKAKAGTPNPAPNPQVGEQANTNSESDSVNGRGCGWVMLNGNPRARGGGTITVSGARPGVDGTYGISEAEHHYSRASGYITRCNLEDPPSTGSTRHSGHFPLPESANNAR